MNIAKFLLNGGSSLLFTVYGFMVLFIGSPLGLEERTLYEVSTYVMLFYILSQGIQFNMGKVSGIKDIAVDLIASFLPLILWAFVVALKESEQEWWNIILWQYFYTILIDIFIFSWSSLKMLLYTDKNASPN